MDAGHHVPDHDGGVDPALEQGAASVDRVGFRPVRVDRMEQDGGRLPHRLHQFDLRGEHGHPRVPGRDGRPAAVGFAADIEPEGGSVGLEWLDKADHQIFGAIARRPNAESGVRCFRSRGKLPQVVIALFAIDLFDIAQRPHSRVAGGGIEAADVSAELGSRDGFTGREQSVDALQDLRVMEEALDHRVPQDGRVGPESDLPRVFLELPCLLANDSGGKQRQREHDLRGSAEGEGAENKSHPPRRMALSQFPW